VPQCASEQHYSLLPQALVFPLMARESKLIQYQAVVLELLKQGLSLRQIAAKPNMPSATTIQDWATEDPSGFGDQYARARQAGLDAMAEKILDIANDKKRDPNCRRVEVDALKWYVSKLAPKRYGDRITQEVSGPDGAPLKQELIVHIVKSPEPEKE
jgi:hypothetical protein